MKNKTKVIFDTNTLISAFIFKGVPLQAVKKAEENENYEILVSVETREELLTVVNREKFDKYISLESRTYLIRNFLSNTRLVHSVYAVENECRDPKDVQFLELAHTAKAHFIVSGDKDLTDLHPFKGVQILSAVEFLEKK